MSLPTVPRGSGAHPIVMVVLAADELDASVAFYRAVFGWQGQAMSKELTVIMPPGGPTVSLRKQMGVSGQTMVPFVSVPNVTAALDGVLATGAAVERAPWKMPMVGTMARFLDASGTVWGVTNGVASAPLPPIPMPMGDNPKPPVHTICHVELYATADAGVGAFVQQHFGWETLETMPQYLAFDAGAGVNGIFQSHTPSLRAVAYVYVEDVAATLNAIDAAGGKRSAQPMPVPGMACFGYFTDPSGTAMGLLGPA